MNLEETIAVKYPRHLFTIQELEEIREESVKKEVHGQICKKLIDHVKNNGVDYFFLNSKYKYQIYVKFFKELLNLEWNIDDKIFVLLPGGWEEYEINELDNNKKLLSCPIEYKIYFIRKDQNG